MAEEKKQGDEQDVIPSANYWVDHRMPNCDFYATPEDHEPLLARLFAEAACEVYETSSDFEQPLKQFESPAEVLSQFERRYPTGEPWHTVHLQLYVLGTGPPFTPRRVEFDPNACGGARFRYAAEGWGLVQLYLSAPRGDRLKNSHTNHNSLKRALAWGKTGDSNPPESWDFERITVFSSRLNRTIRASAAAKIGSRVVLNGALKLWERGASLAPYVPGKHTLVLSG
jgi:hypothetical protein